MSTVVRPIELDDPVNPEMSNPTLKIVALIIIGFVVVIILAIIFAVHLYIGLSAYNEGINGKKSSFYLVVAAIMALVMCLTMTLYFVPPEGADSFTVSSIAALFIDITTVVILVDMIYAALMSRRLAKQMESEAR